MSLSLEPVAEKEDRIEDQPRLKQTAQRKSKQEASNQEPKQVASASASTAKKSKGKNKGQGKSIAGGLSALGSALAGAGFKGRAQLDKEAAQAQKSASAGEIHVTYIIRLALNGILHFREDIYHIFCID